MPAFTDTELNHMRSVVDNDRIARRMAQPMSPVMKAYVKGFDCTYCGTFTVNRYPVRYNETGPFFDNFYCCNRYKAEIFGDQKAQAFVEMMDNIRKGNL